MRREDKEGDTAIGEVEARWKSKKRRGRGDGSQTGHGTAERMRRIMCIDSPENGKTFAASDRLGRILLAGQVRRSEVTGGTAEGVWGGGEGGGGPTSELRLALRSSASAQPRALLLG